MNLLPLVLLAVALGGDKAKSLAEFLSHIDFKSFAPVLKILGFSDKMLETLCSDEFSEMLSGEINAATITKILSGLTRNNDEINIHPHSGWYFIFGHSPNTTSLRTSAHKNACQPAPVTCYP